MAIDKQISDSQKIDKVMNVSIGILLLVIFFTIGLYIYSWDIGKKIENKNIEKTTIDNQISDIKKDDKVILHYLIENNSLFLAKYSEMGKVIKIINNLKIISKTYNINYTTFSYANGMINTNMYAVDDGVSLASKKIENLFSFFRNKNDDIFNLNFVNSFEGQDKISFGASFNLK